MTYKYIHRYNKGNKNRKQLKTLLESFAIIFHHTINYFVAPHATPCPLFPFYFPFSLFFFFLFFLAVLLSWSSWRGRGEEEAVSLLNIKWCSYNLISFPFMHFANAGGRSSCLCTSTVDELREEWD